MFSGRPVIQDTTLIFSLREACIASETIQGSLDLFLSFTD